MNPSQDGKFPKLRFIAEHSVLVEFGDRIDAEVHERVVSLDQSLAEYPFPGLLETVPAFASLLVHFDPIVTDHEAVAVAVHACRNRMSRGMKPPMLREVAVCYDGDFAPDLSEVSVSTAMSEEDVINVHLSGDYRVYMYGFAPGYAYLAGVPNSLRLPRKLSPVRDVPAGSVLIASQQCLVSTLTMPTGWWIIGRSPTPILTQDPDCPFLFDVGDHVKFHRISRQQFESESRG